jgi:hypothetical protein
MSNKEDNLDVMLKELMKLKKELTSINKRTGALEKVLKMREEILKLGWKQIVENYHPDINTSDPAANELFKMYRFVYDDMQKKLLAGKTDVS